MFNDNPKAWAEFIFGKAELGDPRRTKRVVQLAGDLASNVGSSLVKASEDPASIEGAYRFSRNHMIKPEQIALAGFIQTDSIVKQRPLVLAIQDTTGLSFKHSICDELGSVSSASKQSKNPKGRTLYAHSTLMIDAQSEQVLGLANQDYFYREEKIEGKTHELQNRSREEKESFKWQRSLESLSKRMNSLDNVIDVCDREADIYEYLDYQIARGRRFLVRASENRVLTHPQRKLKDAIATLKPTAHFIVDIKQRGGRKARKAKVALSYQLIRIKKPQYAEGEKEITVNMVVCQEVDAADIKEKLCWILYTTEAINSVEEARKLVRYYELRWRIEEFHKTWKSDGTQVELLRMQSRENLKRIAVIQAFIAVRLLQLQELVQQKETSKEIVCTVNFSELSWKILWKKTEKNQSIPIDPPSLYWAYYALAKLGGWYDSKRTGRVGVKALWSGWLKLMDLVESFEILNELKLNDS